MSNQPSLIKHRSEPKNRVAMVFIHGFSGDAAITWGKFPDLLKAQSSLNGWDVLSYGYDTSLRVDILRYLWTADPSIEHLAEALRTSGMFTDLARYDVVCFIAHSMGGLVVQRALLDSVELVRKTSHVILFGTPSDGLVKARLVGLLKPQLAQMAKGSDFIEDLRTRWSAAFRAEEMPFHFLAVAGYNDEFVPRESSLTAFPADQTAMIDGNHLSIVKPNSPGDPSVQLVLNLLTAGPRGVANAARIACDMQGFRETVEKLKPNSDALDRKATVALAMAYDALGMNDKGLEILARGAARDTDIKGSLAGRYKRLWWTFRLDSNAQAAESLYREAYEESLTTKKWDQAFYHGINLAFLAEAYRGEKDEARDLAKKVLEHCKAQRQQADPDKWLLATEGDAYLLLGKIENALQSYRAMLRLPTPPNSREIGSVCQQAIHLMRLREDEKTLEKIEQVFLEETR